MGVEQVTESLNAKEYKSKFRYAESCLYNYQLNLSKIKTLSEKLESLEQGSSVKARCCGLYFKKVLEYVSYEASKACLLFSGLESCLG